MFHEVEQVWHNWESIYDSFISKGSNMLICSLICFLIKFSLEMWTAEWTKETFLENYKSDFQVLDYLEGPTSWSFFWCWCEQRTSLWWSGIDFQYPFWMIEIYLDFLSHDTLHLLHSYILTVLIGSCVKCWYSYTHKVLQRRSPICLPALFHNIIYYLNLQVFVRDFVPNGLACLMKETAEPEIVKNFLLKTLQFQGWEKKIDNYTLGEGAMPASFKVQFDATSEGHLCCRFWRQSNWKSCTSWFWVLVDYTSKGIYQAYTWLCTSRASWSADENEINTQSSPLGWLWNFPDTSMCRWA